MEHKNIEKYRKFIALFLLRNNFQKIKRKIEIEKKFSFAMSFRFHGSLLL